MRATIAEISASNIRHNIAEIRRMAPGCAVFAMVKANSYGHDDVQTSRILREEGVEYLGVAFIDEAMKLRNSGDTGNILIIVSAQPEEADFFIDFNVQTTFSSFEILRAFAKRAAERHSIINAHLFIDSGMNRDGIRPEQAVEFMKEASQYKNINIIGICTHFADSDSEYPEFTKMQIQRFNYALKELADAGFDDFKYIHASNSAAILNFPEAHFNAVRPGISLYGLMGRKELAEKANLKPIMTLKSKVQLVKGIKKGDSVAYSLKYFAKEDTTVAIIPIGYGDGLPRGFSGRAECIIGGKRYPFIGTVCMDQFIAELGPETDIVAGDEVMLIGKQGDEEITAYDYAAMDETIPYEITARLSRRVPRIMVK